MTRREDRDPQIHNIAADYIVNNTLVRDNIGTKPADIPIFQDFKYDGKTSEEVYDDIYKKYDEEELIAKPETFLGEIGAIGVEFGVPATQVTKIVNGLRRGLGAITGRNLFARTSYNMKGLEKYKTEISNVFSKW